MSLPAGLRVVVLHNDDYADLTPEDPGYSARADVENAAWGVAEALIRRGLRAEVQGVDFPSLAEVLDYLARDPPDLVFNLCESLRGDARHEGVVPALLDLAGLPYTGSCPVALGLALRKDRAKMILRTSGVPTPEWITVDAVDRIRGCRLPFPLIVKPTREDASLGISSSSVVRSQPALELAVGRVLVEFGQAALVERYVEGREMYVSLLGNHAPEALPLHEIDFSAMPEGLPRIVSYSGKWDEGSAEYHGTRPVRCLLDETIRLRVVRAACAAFEALELRDYGRVDVRLAADNTPYVIDVNPNCDLTDGAGFSRAAGYGGLGYPQLIERVCEIALERHHRAARLRRPSASPLLSPGGSATTRGPSARGGDRQRRLVPTERGELRPRTERRSARPGSG